MAYALITGASRGIGLSIATELAKRNIDLILIARDEASLDINKGDLSVHCRRLWHRVKESSLYGIESRRRVMYIPMITGKKSPKNEFSKTPFYHRISSKIKI